MENKPASKIDDLKDLIPPFDQRGMDLGIERMQLALKDMENPCAHIPAIQIIGTNGKGSIASFIQSMLKVAGIKAGVTTSPHLVSWCERIQIDGEMISSKEFRQHLIHLYPLAEAHQLTPFELVMATAFKHFAKHKVELLVLEAGLGGRLDATTAHPFRPIIAIANIGLDHCEYLGKDIESIAKEKFAVIPQGSTVISGTQHPDVNQILTQTINEKRAQIQWVDTVPQDWDLGLNGEIQRKNAAVAKGAVQSLRRFEWNINKRTIRKGLALANWPGRLQSTSWQGLPLFIDGAHNPSAAEQLAKERDNWNQAAMGVQWILGIQQHKEAPQMLRYLIKPYDIAWIVPVPGHNSWSKLQLSKACPELAKQLIQANEVLEVFYTLRIEKQWPTPPPVVAGSLYLIGDLLTKEIINNQIGKRPIRTLKI